MIKLFLHHAYGLDLNRIWIIPWIFRPANSLHSSLHFCTFFPQLLFAHHLLWACGYYLYTFWIVVHCLSMTSFSCPCWVYTYMGVLMGLGVWEWWWMLHEEIGRWGLAHVQWEWVCWNTMNPCYLVLEFRESELYKLFNPRGVSLNL